ncbi:RNA-binding protein 43-like [Leucoraja erinacea]|uniref:RNA-binding protein 43-like n=1 Tax=Leucoraja erinaceus TaxID=7782 RepID=UPI00245659DF|nr:RNA-binding protein 43-like [Leucoraja erinacea]
MKRQDEAQLGAGCCAQQPEETLQRSKKIQVLNVPAILPEQRTLDKLIIHFQARGNGGGEVLDMEYPTTVAGRAFITFAKEEDADNVLKREQILKLDQQDYKLDVREVGGGETTSDTVQVIEFVSTKLDTRDYPSKTARQLIHEHRFQIVSDQGSMVVIRGSFSSLKELRRKLTDLIVPQSTRAVTGSRT